MKNIPWKGRGQGQVTVLVFHTRRNISATANTRPRTVCPGTPAACSLATTGHRDIRYVTMELLSARGGAYRLAARGDSLLYFIISLLFFFCQWRTPMTYYLLTAVSFHGHSAASSLLFFSVFLIMLRVSWQIIFSLTFSLYSRPWTTSNDLYVSTVLK